MIDKVSLEKNKMHLRIILDNASGELTLRKPYAYAEIALQEIEKIILTKLPAGVTFTNVSFRQIKLDRPVLPKLKVALRSVPKKTATQLEPCSIAKLIAIDEIALLNRKFKKKNLKFKELLFHTINNKCAVKGTITELRMSFSTL
jgi:hypothetical protein